MVGASTTSCRRIEAGEELLGTFLDLGSPLAAEIIATRRLRLARARPRARRGRARRHARPAARGARAGGRARAVAPRARSSAGCSTSAPRASSCRASRARRGRRARSSARATRRPAGCTAACAPPASAATPATASAPTSERVVMIQIETRGALDDVGGDRRAARRRRRSSSAPTTSATRSGCRPAPESPEMQAIAGARRGAAREAGKAAAVFLGDPALAPRYRELGFTLIASGSAAGCWPASAARAAGGAAGMTRAPCCSCGSGCRPRSPPPASC